MGQYKTYIKKGCRAEDKIRVGNYREESFKATENASEVRYKPIKFQSILENPQ